MTALLRRALTTAGVLGGLLVAGHPAGAGQKSEVPVFVSGFQAAGALGSARNTTDGNQWIGCELSSWNGQAPVGYCYANTASNAWLSCSTTHETHIKLISALPSDGYINFQVNASGVCSSLDVRTTSHYPPKKP